MEQRLGGKVMRGHLSTGRILLVVLVLGIQSSHADMVSHWSFNERSGSTAYDSDGINHGTIYGAQWTTGLVGGALSFDGEDDYVNCGNDASTAFSSGDSFTLEALVQYSGLSTFGAIAARHDDSSATFNYAFGIANNKLVFVGDQAHVGSYWLRSDIDLLENQWYHVAGVYDRGSMAVYVNGLEHGTALFTYGGSADLAADFVIGNTGHWPGYDDNRYFDGLIDELMLYDEALTSDEILEHCVTVVPLPASVLLGSIGLSTAGWLFRRKRT